jgi:hypothetical protein
MKETITFTWTKETKSKQRFDAPTGGAVTGSLYLNKDLVGDAKTITVIVG